MRWNWFYCLVSSSENYFLFLWIKLELVWWLIKESSNLFMGWLIREIDCSKTFLSIFVHIQMTSIQSFTCENKEDKLRPLARAQTNQFQTPTKEKGWAKEGMDGSTSIDTKKCNLFKNLTWDKTEWRNIIHVPDSNVKVYLTKCLCGKFYLKACVANWRFGI